MGIKIGRNIGIPFCAVTTAVVFLHWKNRAQLRLCVTIGLKEVYIFIFQFNRELLKTREIPIYDEGKLRKVRKQQHEKSWRTARHSGDGHFALFFNRFNFFHFFSFFCLSPSSSSLPFYTFWAVSSFFESSLLCTFSRLLVSQIMQFLPTFVCSLADDDQSSERSKKKSFSSLKFSSNFRIILRLNREDPIIVVNLIYTRKSVGAKEWKWVSRDSYDPSEKLKADALEWTKTNSQKWAESYEEYKLQWFLCFLCVCSLCDSRHLDNLSNTRGEPEKEPERTFH